MKRYLGTSYLAVGLWMLAAVDGHHPQVLRARTTAPAPTIGPQIHELRRRQQTGDVEGSIIWMASDRTCGYLSGSAGAALTCGAGSTCNIIPNLIPTATSKLGVIICCDAAECGGYISCVNSDIANNPSSCDDVCQGNTLTLKCSNSELPFCRTVVYETSITDFNCVKFSATGIASAEFTYSGWEGSWPLETTTLPPLGSGSTSNTRFPFSPSPKTNDPESPTSSGAGPATSAVDEDSGGSKTGAIVGGTIGGIAAAGLLGLGAAFLIRRRRNGPPTAPESATSPYPMTQQQYSFPPNPHHSIGPQSPMSMDDSIMYTASPNMSPVPEEQKFQPFVPGNQMAPSTYDPRGSVAGQDPAQMGYASRGMEQPMMPPQDQIWQQQQHQMPQQGPYEMGSEHDHHRGNMHEMYAPRPGNQ